MLVMVEDSSDAGRCWCWKLQIAEDAVEDLGDCGRCWQWWKNAGDA
jgi:hypothetical protein